MAREFDIIVFGASGFTGKHVVKELAKTVSEKEPQIKWAVAGRSKEKLQAVLDQVAQDTGIQVKNVTIVEADTGNRESLDEMCKRTKIVLNCVGPYYFYGEPIVKACIDNGADQIDVSGEPLFLEGMELKYNEEAKKAKVYVLGACGFDSVPCETGIQVLKEKFGGDVNAIEEIMQFRTGSEVKLAHILPNNFTAFGLFYVGTTSGHTINSGTWDSAVNGIASQGELKSIRKQLFTNPLPKSNYPLKRRGVLFYQEDVKKWCIPFPVTDPTVVRRTQYYNYNHRKLRPSPSTCYLALSSVFQGIAFLTFALFFGIMSSFKLGRTLLSKYPSFFSFGFFSKNGPSRKQIEEASFKIVLVGHGYDETLRDPNQQHSHQPNKNMIVTVSGPEPGYVATPICMIQVALCVLQERDKLPEEGGVITPGAALLNTSIMSRLSENGIKFSVGLD